MTVTCVLTYIIALIPLKCFSMPHDESKLLNKVDNVELGEPSEFKDVIIVNEKKNSRDFWANYLARFEESKGRGQEKRGRDMPCYLSGFSFRERQSYERKIKSEILLKLKKNKMFNQGDIEMFFSSFENRGKRGSFSMFSSPSIAYQIYQILNDRRSEQFLFNGLHNRIM